MGGGPTINVPGPSEEERALDARRVELLETQTDILSRQLREQQLLAPFLFSRAGLIPQLNEAGEIIGFEEDPDSIFARQQELSGLFFEQELEQFPQKQKLLDLQLGILEDTLEAEELLGPLRSETETLALERQKSALKGELPLPSGLERQFEDDEAILRESLRQQLGPGFETSTAGIQALEEFRRNKEITFDAARRAEITGIQGVTASKEALAQGTVGGLSGNPVGSFLSNVAGINALPGQPFQGFAQVGQGFGAINAQKQQDRNFLASLQVQGALSGGSTLGTIFQGAQAAASVASLFAGSSRSIKEKIVELSEADLDTLLTKIEEMPIYSWQYTGDNERHIGPVTEEAPREITDEDRKILVSIDCIGILFASIKAMATEMSKLREKIDA